MTVKVEENKVNFCINNTAGAQSTANIDLTFDEAAELISFLQGKMLKK